MNTIQIQIENLTKLYHSKIILDNISICLTNEKYIFIEGENGSGKTTFLKCICHFVQFQGKIKNPYTISYVPEKIMLPPYLKVIDFIELIARVKKITCKDKIEMYLRLFHMEQYQDMSIQNLSLGTKQKIILIQSLIENRDIYIFDEPLNGLDDETKQIFKKEIQKLKRKGKLIIIVSHQKEIFGFRKKQILSLRQGKLYEQLDSTT